jgi:hypothetical protein
VNQILEQPRIGDEYIELMRRGRVAMRHAAWLGDRDRIDAIAGALTDLPLYLTACVRHARPAESLREMFVARLRRTHPDVASWDDVFASDDAAA